MLSSDLTLAMLSSDYTFGSYPTVNMDPETTKIDGEEEVEPGPLECLPVELIQEIMVMLAPRALSKFVRLNKRFMTIYLDNAAHIVSSVLLQQPEFQTILYMYISTDRSSFQPSQMLLRPRIVDFNAKENYGTMINLLRANVPSDDDGSVHDAIYPDRFVLEACDMVELWKFCIVIDWWVERYPSMRWRDDPENRRCLRPQEEARLRKALAHWWMYSWFFDGNYHRDLYRPRKWHDDKRLQYIRLLSTREICELEDLRGVIFDTVSRDLCSSPQRVFTGHDYSVELVPWGSDRGRHRDVVNTYLKLDPEQVKYFLEVFYRRRKMDIIKAIRSSTNDFNLDRESLSYSITTVLEERVMAMPKEITGVPPSGILDEDRVIDGSGDDSDDDGESGDVWSKDGSLNGKHPLTDQQVGAFPAENERRLPHGDDGDSEPR